MSLHRPNPDRCLSLLLLACLALALGCQGPGGGADKHPEEPATLTIARLDGKEPIKIDLEGRPEFVRAAVQDLHALTREATFRIRELGSDDAVALAYRDSIIEMQGYSIEDLSLAIKISDSTSGPPPVELLTLAHAQNAMLATAVAGVLPSELDAVTKIDTDIDGAVSIHYMSMGEYRKQSKDWRSYRSGTPIRIGFYMFRVSRVDRALPPIDERVGVFRDPFRHTITLPPSEVPRDE